MLFACSSPPPLPRSSSSKGYGQSLPPMLGTSTADGFGRARGINDGKGFVFISHLGEVFPTGFLPVSDGNIRKQSLTELYRHSPLFVLAA